jgi:regulator of RNase E activity RraA
MAKCTLLLLAITGLVSTQSAAAQDTAPFSQQFLQVKAYSQEENEALAKKFKGLRTTDVADALQMVGLHGVTVMDREVAPMWIDNQKFSHVIYGVAVTLRLVPPQERAPAQEFATEEDFRQWMGNWSKRWMGRGLASQIKPDTVLVIEAPLRADNGYCGSNNAMGWMALGLRGIVTDAGCRDSDEMRIQEIPVYQRDSTRFINQGTIAIESYNRPVVVGGVLVMPGDIIVADLDGVAVVPRAKAEKVAAFARKIRDDDNKVRQRQYEKLGRPPDFTLKP